MNYEQLLEFLTQNGGSRSIDTPAELKMRMGSLGNRYGSRSIDTQAENSLLRGALSGLYSPSMAYLMKLANDAYGSRGIDTTEELKMRMGSLGNQDSTQNILRSILEQQ